MQETPPKPATRPFWGRWVAYALYTLVVFEIVARLAFNHSGFLERIERVSCVGAEVSLKHQARLAMSTGENGMVDRRMPTPLAHHPDYGWMMREGEFERPGVRLGPRGRLPGVSAKRPDSGRPLVVAYGDSFTFGDEVDDDHTWVNLVDAAWPEAVVENRGVLGWGTDQVLMRASDEIEVEQPNLVLVGVNAVSLVRTDERVGAWLKPWMTPNLVVVGRPVSGPQALVSGLSYRPWSADLFRVLTAPRRHGFRPDTAVAVLDGLRKLFLENGVPFALVWLPQRQDWEQEGGSKERAAFVQWCGSQEAPCVDLTDAFIDAHNRGVRLLGKAHWTEAGYQLAADEVVRRIQPPLP